MNVPRRLIAIPLYLLAAMLFLAAALLSPRPVLPPTPVPDAGDVAAMKTLARGTIAVLRQDGPAPLAASRGTAQSAARVAAYSRPDVRAAADIVGGVVHGRLSVRLASATWLNMTASAAQFRGGADPHLRIRIGSIAVPAPLTHWAADGVIALLWPEDSPAPTFRQIWPALSVERNSAAAIFDVPKPLVRGVQRLLGIYSEDVETSAQRTYLRLTRADRYLAPAASLGAYMREGFGPNAGTLPPKEAAGRLVGMLMAGYDPAFLRFAGTAVFRADQDRSAPRIVMVEGRRDLVAHYLVSAALTATGGQDVSNAIGEVKELSDSMGGSGFSFVDLTADRAGTRLGALLADPKTTARTQALLAKARTEDLFPLAALNLSEGMTSEEFEARYKTLDSRNYQRAVARIDAALDQLPIYQQ